MSDREGRPSPDALLKEAARGSGRGRLKIFLGAAPGVGKTFEMLTAARARHRDGVDVVAGIVETHGRAETAALLEGIEILPRRSIDYKGRVLEEMDLDALLARRPALALVDELAHSNAPGSRHPKRYLDVQELIEAGIDVWTTLNIQHVESLNDVVASITRIRVRETVPDGVLDRADEIEVVDLTPDDLMQRLREGRVYVSRTASRALDHYFSPGNLTALRELALRRTAQRVDAQLLDHMQAHAITGPWAAGERVLVCITGSQGGAALVRYGRRLSERLRAPWTALHIETAPRPGLGGGMATSEPERIADTMRLAERLGAEAVTIPGRDVAGDILAYAREHNFVHLVVGKPARRGPFAWARRSVTTDLIARAGEFPVHVVGGAGDAPVRGARVARPQRPGPYIATSLIVAAAVVVGLGLQLALTVSSIALVFLTAVLIAAAAFGLWPALYACLASVLAYNFFFLPPVYTFTIADPENVVALFFFLITALVAGNLAAGMRAQAVAARGQARTTEDLYRFSRKLAGILDMDDLLWATAYQVATMLGVRVVVLLPQGTGVPQAGSVAQDGGIAVRGGYPPEDELDPADLAAAIWCWKNNREAGRGADTLPGARRLFLPLRTARGPVGVLGIDRDEPAPGGTRPLLAPDQRRLLDALADQAAVAIERVTLAADVDRTRLLAETERLRSALLTSISHDLRTPLAAILGAASGLASYHALLDEAGRRDLLATIREEAERLNRFVGNLLDMTRLESGALAPRLEAVDLGEMVGAALARAGRVLADHRVEMDLAADLPLLRIDPVLFEQVLFNLLDNAAKYAPDGSVVRLRAWHEPSSRSHGPHPLGDDGMVRLQVIDEGPGLPEDALELVFDKFRRIPGGDRQRAGTGLGLAICRGFVEAMGGTVLAGNRRDRSGAVFTVSFPALRAAPQSETPHSRFGA